MAINWIQTMKKTCNNDIVWILSACMTIIFTACTSTLASQMPTISPSPTSTQTPIATKSTPADEHTNSDNFGDGYTSRVPIKDFNNLAPEEIVKTLVIQWLEHYKTQSQVPNVALKDYTLDKINLLDISSSSGFEIVAGVKFSIIPAQVPNDWASFPGDTISPNDVWWHLSAPFGIFKDGEYLILKLVFGWGT